MKNRAIGKNIAIIVSLLLVLFWLFPYLYVISCSFKPGSEVIAVPPSFSRNHFPLRILRICFPEWMRRLIWSTV